MQLRKHQREVLETIDGIIGGSPVRNIVVNATPGSGKSALPLVAGRLITAGFADKIAWICPRSSLQDQGERNFLDPFFRKMVGHNLIIRSATNNENPSRGTAGFITTFQAVGADRAETVLRELRRHRYVLVIDEGHHAADGGNGKEEAWMKAMIPLYEEAKYRLIMSGTMSRNDGKRIAFIPYRQIGPEEYKPCFEGRDDTAYIKYNRTDALADRAIIPLEFVLHDGLAEWEKEGDRKRTRISTGAVGDSKDAIFTALHTGYARELLDTALDHWEKWRMVRPTSRFLVVAANIKVTQEYTEYLAGKGLHAVIATSDDDKAAAKAIKAFKAGKIPVLVTCQVAYEGLDCPAISHIACLTRIRSLEWITQMCGRAVRIDPLAGPYETQRGHIFAPADRMFVELARKIEADQCEAVAKEKEEVGIRENGGNGNGRRPGITPLSSKLIPGQEDLFGYASLAETGPVPKTQREIETELREEIDEHVRGFARTYNVKPARMNYEIKEIFGKPRENMTVEELQRLKSWLESNYRFPQRRKPDMVLAQVARWR